MAKPYSVQTPHDSFFKLVFKRAGYAASLLRHLLPATAGSQIDWSTLQLVDGSDVDARLRQSHSDVVFEARLIADDERIYFVIEHKSTP